MRPVIAVPAYQRAGSLKRLLTSIGRSRIPEGVRLVISLEGGASDDVRAVAEDFKPGNLDVVVRLHTERLGLRKHILACGDEALTADGVIVLEDDLMVDACFYQYTSAALEHYRQDERVAGIALYAPEFNELAGIPFVPLRNGYSTYPMRVPCSWGQAWTSDQWKRFRAWYANADTAIVESRIDLPEQVRRWPESSWKKYFACYLVSECKDVIYPYEAYSTNCSDAGGAHIRFGSDVLQVRLGYAGRPSPIFRFCDLDEPAVAYDAYMEPCGSQISEALGMGLEEVEVDLNGLKPLELLRRKRHTVTSKQVSERLATFPLRLRPIELNLEHPSDEAAEAAVWLARTDAVTEGRRTRRTVGEYSYHSGIRVGSRPVLFAVLRGIPAALPGFIERLRG